MISHLNKLRNRNESYPSKTTILVQFFLPFEGIFSEVEKRARDRGLAKVQMQAFLEANVKRLVVIGSPPLFTGA